jgi:hypothetical protein
MKKIYLLALALTTSLSFGQLVENFDGAAALPSGWTQYIGTNGEGTVENWNVVANPRAYSAANCAYVRYEVVANAAQDWLVTPLVDLTNYTAVSLNYWGGSQYTAEYGTIYTVRVSTTSQTDINSFTTVATYGEVDFATTTPMSSQKTVDLSAYNGQQIYVAFVMEQNDGDNWFIDNVDITGTLGTSSFNNFETKVSLYPNPTNGLVNILTKENVETIEVYSIIGNLLKTVSNKNNVDFSDLANGSYFVKVKTNDGVINTQKVIKN